MERNGNICEIAEAEMARFSVGGDEDGNEDRLPNRPLPKRPRVSTPTTFKRSIAAAAAAASNSRDRPTTSAAASAPAPAPQPQAERIPTPEDERAATVEDSSDESDSSWSDSLSESSSEESAEEEEDVQQQPQTHRSADEVQQAEARVVPVASGSGASREPEGSSGSVSVTLTDPDVLDCPICYEPLCSPVYQCENGHIACSSCCTTMKNKCASCCWPIGYNRCRAIEKVLESVRIACRNMPRGCKEKFSYSNRLAHEKICTFAPCSCPYIGCDYSNTCKYVYAHFYEKHTQSSKQFRINEPGIFSLDKNQKHIFLQERVLSPIFIINRSVESVGSFVNVVCVAPTSEKKAYMYDLTATFDESSIRLKSVVEVMPRWMAQPPSKAYLIVPSSFVSTSGQLKLELKIWRNPLHLSGSLL